MPTTRTWLGGTGAFYDATQWNNGVPILGDTLIISAGAAQLINSQAPSSGEFDAENVTLGSRFSSAPAKIVATEAYLGLNFDITSDSTAPYATFSSVGTSAFAGVITASATGGTFTIQTQADGSTPGKFVLLEGGLLQVTNGDTLAIAGRIDVESTLNMDLGSTLSNNGTLNILSSYSTTRAMVGNVLGTGTMQVGQAAALELRDVSVATQKINFVGIGGVLLIDTYTDYASTITNFQPGDTIGLPNVPATSASYDATTGLISVFEAVNGGPTLLITQLHVTGPTSSGALQVTPSGSGGSFLTYVNSPDAHKVAITAADVDMGSNVARSTLKTAAGATLTGAGETIGIISVGFNTDGKAPADQAAGYLPSYSIINDAPKDTQNSTNDNEGRAMAELVHQVAPGATIVFDDPANEADMANAINMMVSQYHVNVITDDLSFTDEPFFQVAGTLDTSIQNAINAGVSYFTASDNYGNAYYEAPFKPTTTTLAGIGSEAAQTFTDGTTLQTITMTLETTVALQWDAPFPTGNNTVPGTLNFALFQNGRLATINGAPAVSAQVVNSATSDNGFANEPEAELNGVPTGTYQIAIYQTAGTPTPAYVRYSLFGAGSGTGPGGYIDDPAAQNGGGQIFGQGLVPGVNTVASEAASNSPAFTGDDFTEPASDAGPGTLLFDSNGNRLATPVSDGKPVFTAPDGVYLSADLTAFQPFYGTSAASPDAAAVAALMMQANPSLTPAQVTADMAASAVSLGESANRQGAGLVQAVPAVELALGGASGGASTIADTVMGAGNAIYSVDFGSSTLATLAASLFANLTAANTLFANAGGAVTMSGAQTAAVDGAAGAVTLGGGAAANETIAAGAGAFAFHGGTGGSGTVVAGGGADSVFLPGGGNWVVLLGNGADTVAATTGNDTITTGAGGSFVFLGAGASSVASSATDTILGAAGSATVSASNGNNDEVFALAGKLDFLAGSGASTVVGGGAGATIAGGTGASLVFADGGTQYTGGGGVDTVVGLNGSMTVRGGPGGGLFFGGTAGANVITGGAGPVTAFGGGAGDVLTATGSAADLFAGGTGAETLAGAGSSGSNTFFAGFGPETLTGGSGSTALVAGAGADCLAGGAGVTLFLFVNGRTSGAADTIAGFDATHDFVKLAGYTGNEAATVQNAVVRGGSAVVALSDGTSITFAGVGQLNAGSFT